MAWTPISGDMTQYSTSANVLASSYYLKFYKSGTTTAFSMATDSTGGTTLAKCQLDSSGYPTTDGTTRFIPHVNQKYKIALYKNATDADNNTTGNADWIIDLVDQVQTDQTDAWVLFSGTPTQTSATTFTLTGDQTSTFTVGSRLKFDDSSTLYGNVTVSAYTTLTTVTVVLDSGSLSGSLSAVYTSIADTVSEPIGAASVNYLPAGTGAVATNVQAKLRESVSVKDYGAVGDGVTDDYAAFTSARDTGNKVYIPPGVYYLSQKLSTSASESDAFIIEGSGMSQCILAFNGTSGVELLGTNNVIRDLTIIDRAAYTTPVTTLALFHSQLPQKANITAATIGLKLDRNQCRADNIQTMGFDYGQMTDNTKFYMTFMNCRSHYNLIGFVGGDGTDTPNFCRSYASYYSSNFDKNVWLRTGFHRFIDCSFELCSDYDANNANFPDGGIHIESAAHGYFEHPYIEESNFYNASSKTRVYDTGNMWNGVVFAPTTIDAHQFGIRSPNLVRPPHRFDWLPQTSGAVTIDTTSTNIDANKRYARLTASGAAAVSKVVQSPWSSRLHGLTPPTSANIDYKMYCGFYVKIGSANFTASHPFWRVQIEDTAGTLYYCETPTRTMVFDATDGFDNSDTSNWQYVGAFFAIRNTFATGVAISRIRIELTVEDAAQDCSAANRIMDISEPELRMYYGNDGHEYNMDEMDLPTLTKIIVSGEVKLQDYHESYVLQAQSGTADDVDTITGGYDGQVLDFVADSGDTITFKDGTGNINLGSDVAVSGNEVMTLKRLSSSNWVRYNGAA